MCAYLEVARNLPHSGIFLLHLQITLINGYFHQLPPRPQWVVPRPVSYTYSAHWAWPWRHNYRAHYHPKHAVSSAWAPPRSSKVSMSQKKSHHQASSEGHPVSVSTIVNNSVGRSDNEPLIDDDDYEDEEEQEEEDDAECVPDLVEGDIAIPEEENTRPRLAIDFLRFPAKKWPNNTVPYRISKNYTTSEELMILSAMRTISFVSCIKFVDWDGERRDYIHFHPDSKRLGCWSYIGRQNKRQQLSLQRPSARDCACFCSPGRAMHEIMHALGFYHEHARSDRDQYIKIIDKNVRRGKHGNFNFQNDDESSRNFNYDYNSIMHYGPYYFSKNKRRRKATIVPLKPGVTIGQRDMLSKTDCMKLNSQYSCFPADNMDGVRKIQIICGMVGV